jgi:hypothetical protein
MRARFPGNDRKLPMRAAVAAAPRRSEPSLNQDVIELLGCHNLVPIVVFPD